MSKRFEHWKKVTHKDNPQNTDNGIGDTDRSTKDQGTTSAFSAATTNEDRANMQADAEHGDTKPLDDMLDHENYTDI